MWLRVTRVLLGIIGVAALFVVAACSSQSAAPTTSGSASPTQGGASAPKASGASLVFDETAVDFGKVPFDKMVEKSFVYRNIGTKPISIVEKPRVDTVAGC